MPLQTESAYLLHRSFELAELVGEERNGIYELLTAAQLRELLMRFRASALEMLACGQP